MEVCSTASHNALNREESPHSLHSFYAKYKELGKAMFPFPDGNQWVQIAKEKDETYERSVLVFSHHEIDLFDKNYVDELTNDFLPKLCHATKQSPHLIPYDEFYFHEKNRDTRSFFFVSKSDPYVVRHCASSRNPLLFTLEQAIFTKSQLEGKATLFTIDEIQHALVCILEGLAILHENGITHKNITPKSILLSADKDTRFLLSNYGIGFEKIINMLTENDLYLAPEVLEEERYSTKSDIFAFGVVMLKMLTMRDITVEFSDQFRDNIRSEILNLYNTTNEFFLEIINDILCCIKDEESSRPNATDILRGKKHLKSAANIMDRSLVEQGALPQSTINLLAPLQVGTLIPRASSSSFRKGMIHVKLAARPSSPHSTSFNQVSNEERKKKKEKVKILEEKSLPYVVTAKRIEDSEEEEDISEKEKKTQEETYSSASTVEASRLKQESESEKDIKRYRLFEADSIPKQQLSHAVAPKIIKSKEVKPRSKLYSFLSNISQYYRQFIISPGRSNTTEKDSIGQVASEIDEEKIEHVTHKDLYNIVERIGMGAQCTCFLVQKDGVQYAMKRYKAGHFREYFNEKNVLEELQILQSPFLVKMIEGFEEFEKRENMNDNVYYLILEYCSKGDLAKFLQRNRRKPLPYSRFLRFSIQILKGIVSMHEIGIGHFDLKPANIFLCEDYSVKLGDFGFSGSFGKEVTGGSLEYIAPEQLTTKTANLGNAKYDIFAFGTICLELLTRKKRDLKLEMKTEDWLDVIWNNECMNDYPKALLPILKSLLHPSGNKRPTAKDVLNQFEILEKDPDQHL